MWTLEQYMFLAFETPLQMQRFIKKKIETTTENTAGLKFRDQLIMMHPDPVGTSAPKAQGTS